MSMMRAMCIVFSHSLGFLSRTKHFISFLSDTLIACQCCFVAAHKSIFK